MSEFGRLLSILFICKLIEAYKHVILIHGVMAGGDTLEKMASVILKEHPGTNVTVLNSYPDLFSMNPLWLQVKGLKRSVEEICRHNKDGIHFIGYSQGGIIARGIIQTMKDHNIDTFISLASPQMGIYGVPSSPSGLLNYFEKGSITPYLSALHKLRGIFYKIIYSNFGQLISISEYWKDPFQLNLYLNTSSFLPILNNEIEHRRKREFKENFVQLKKLVLIGGPDDGTIVPWQSSLFGYFKENSDDVAEMKEHEVYKKDYFGLKTLDERGALYTVTVSNASHDDWIFNEYITKEYILPWLT